ncbi:MAG: L-fucose/L-arabinose isomerase family protein [Clostridiales bacterium]|jgi:L-fucose isomerase-like protein|uniref:L-fucose/L-arabinose isomerase family protein n=1 Tax=Chordicoccus furentiruminis TaxID=2709410 RepID=UPI0023A84ECB|nr:L-fucose/L-arabinose isomerase family protein [Chordicoccus furentiruminis]MCI6173027.1 L-fucose/L-arabinose isomerase family protein [Clostridiales bacterium]
MNNAPEIKIGIVGVSRDCFPASLTKTRREALVKAYAEKYDAKDIYECPITIIESEIDMVNALADIKAHDCNALCVYLGNFGPEISETLLAKHFDGPKMFCAAAEENIAVLSSDRGDAYCGMLNASYNLQLRNVKAYIPENPVGDAEECADMIHDFLPVARAVYALQNLKIISFGPRPQNFLACNAPIKQLYNLGVEIEENSELDLYESFLHHEGDKRIPDVVKDMEEDLGCGNKKPEILPRLAQYELTLKDWIEAHKGYRKYVALTTKCWPAFQTMFKFVPCYVNSRLTGQGIPVSCEVDIYGTLSEFIGEVVSGDAVTLLDINNTVPKEIFEQDIRGKFDYKLTDTFMGFHCGNTCTSKLKFHEMKYQKIMARSLPIEVTNGTLEGDIVPGDVTFYRLQSTADGKIRAYIAEGEVLPVATRSFGSIGIFAIPEMGRFYRHVLIEKGFPHHGAVAFGKQAKYLFEVFKYIGVPVDEIGYNQPAGVRYPDENPWA